MIIERRKPENELPKDFGQITNELEGEWWKSIVFPLLIVSMFFGSWAMAGLILLKIN